MTTDEPFGDARADVLAGRTLLGIELGSTRIKAVLIAPDGTPVASGGHAWENAFVDRMWTYPLDAVWAGLAAAVGDLQADLERRVGVRVGTVAGLGVSAMMHGYLAFDAAGEWELENIAVAPAFQRRGVAGKLLKVLIDHMRQNHASTVFLEVRESNLPARRFYEKQGFNEVGRRRHYYHRPDEDAVLYKLDLGSGLSQVPSQEGQVQQGLDAVFFSCRDPC